MLLNVKIQTFVFQVFLLLNLGARFTIAPVLSDLEASDPGPIPTHPTDVIDGFLLLPVLGLFSESESENGRELG